MNFAYYNENDPKAAAWLRELIQNKCIAYGEVDERDIQDVKPKELEGYTQCHFFAGIGGWSLALKLAGWPDDRPVWTGSCPCQPFSAAGRGAGFADDRHLYPHFAYLIKVKRPPVIFGEQVASKAGRAWLDIVQTDMEANGYAFGAADIGAAGVGAPHWRQRNWFVLEELADPGRASDERIRRSGQASRAPGQDENQTQQRERSGSTDRSSVSLGSLADAHIKRQPGPGQLGEPSHSAQVENREVGGIIDAGGGVRLADLQSPERELTGNTRTRGPGPSDSSNDVNGLADNKLQQRQVSAPGHNEARRRDQKPTEIAGLRSDSRTSPLDGFWSNADWLHCRDGKWRPVEPGTFPLAHGVPGRVGQLRGYGNAIVPQVAQEIIEAYMSQRIETYFEGNDAL